MQMTPMSKLSVFTMCRLRYQRELRRLMSTNSTTVDLNDVKRHEAHKDGWWSPSGPMKALHSMNKVRVPLVRDGLIATKAVESANINTAKPLQHLKILDVGCGGGILSEALARIGADVTGLDMSNELIDAATSHSSKDDSIKNNLKYVVSSIEDHSTTNHETYDAIVASEIIEHVDNKDFFVKSCVNVLKPGGSIFFTTLDKTRASWALGIVVAEYLLGILPRGTHDWNKFISPGDLSKILHAHGCSTHLLHGLQYFPLNNTWYYIPNTLINYALHAVKIQKP